MMPQPRTVRRRFTLDCDLWPSRRGVQPAKGPAATAKDGLGHDLPLLRIPQQRMRSFRANTTIAFFFDTPLATRAVGNLLRRPAGRFSLNAYESAKSMRWMFATT